MTNTQDTNIAQLKSTKNGDMVVILYSNGICKLFEVINRHPGVKGRDGFTTVEIINIPSGEIQTIKIKNKLPEDIKLIRKVSKGTNSRTAEKNISENFELPRVEIAPLTLEENDAETILTLASLENL